MDNYTFENYFATENSSFAKNVCKKIAETCDSKYSPLLIYGEPGSGKTHLAKAIEGYIKSQYNDKTVKYIDADCFTENIILSMKPLLPNNHLILRATYNTADVFIFDGLEKIQNRDTSKEELLNIIKQLNKDNKTIILTSALATECLFNDYYGLKRIVESSYLVRLDKQEPLAIDFLIETDLLEGCSLSDELLWFIKRNCGDKVSKAKGMINTISMWMDINKREPSQKELQYMFDIPDVEDCE
jgi:chromosomal replication initiation ATPase DnaA